MSVHPVSFNVRRLLRPAIAAIFWIAWALPALGETCETTSRVCTQGAATRIIDGVAVTRDCWQWQEVKNCVTAGSPDACRPLEEKAGCSLKNETCLESVKPGECRKNQKTFACDKALSPVPADITALPVELTVTDRWDSSACGEENDAACRPFLEVCTRPNASVTIDGFPVTLACAERLLTYRCTVGVPNPSCEMLAQAGCKAQKTTKETMRREEPLPRVAYRCDKSASDLPVHPDITIESETTVLDGVEDLATDCALQTVPKNERALLPAGTATQSACRVESSTCLTYHPTFADVCVKEAQRRVCSAGINDAACTPLKKPACAQTDKGTDNEKLEHYRCQEALPMLPENITEIGREEVIDAMHEINTCPATLPALSDRLHQRKENDQVEPCQVVSRACIEGEEERIVAGRPVYKDCWKESVTYACGETATVDTCEALAIDKKCRLTDSSCVSFNDKGECSLTTQTYTCEKTPATTVTEEVCTQTLCQYGLCTQKDTPANTGVTDAVAKLEIARQAAVYGEYKNLRFFSGTPNTCRNKLGGVSCCRGKVRANVNNAAGLGAAYVFAADVAQEAIHTVGSPYVNDLLSANDTVASLMTKLYGQAAFEAYSPSLSYYGLTVSYAAGQMQFNFSPATFFAMVALDVAQDYLSCEPEEQALQLKRGSNLCHYVGSRCTQYNLGHCLEKTETHCCFNSQLALIVQKAAKAQLGLTWGTPEAPLCEGLTAYEFAQVDMGRIDPQTLAAALGATHDMTTGARKLSAEKTQRRAQKRKETINPDKPYEEMPQKDGVTALTHSP